MMASSDELQRALDHVDEALQIVSRHLNANAFQAKGRTELADAETELRAAARLLTRERNFISYEEKRNRAA